MLLKKVATNIDLLVKWQESFNFGGIGTCWCFETNIFRSTPWIDPEFTKFKFSKVFGPQ
jgi:hypothetical protein